jgi:perosamine synthetase
MAALCSRKYGIAVTNGSAALDIAVAALQLPPGTEIIMPAFTIISCAAAVVRAGCIPVLVDADPITWNMKTEDIEAKINSKTSAIMVVHIYGLPVDVDKVLELAKKYDLKVIEDAAEMHGQTFDGMPCGSFGDISTFSFYPNKHITTGEGGMIVTDDENLAESCRSYRNLFFPTRERRYIHDEL